MSYATIKDSWVGEQWGDGGVYWYNHLAPLKGLVTSSSDSLDDIINNSAYWADGLLGISTSTSTTVLTDTNITLVVDAQTGWYLNYLSGPAAGISAVIVSNTAHTVTTATLPQTPTADGGDDFSITQFPLVKSAILVGKFTNSSDGNLSWVTWGPVPSTAY